MRLYTLLLLIAACITSTAQTLTDLNNYKYVVVANQYDFQNSSNQFRFNEHIVFELKKKGFKAFLASKPMPKDMNKEQCNTLQLHLEGNTGLFTKMQFFFKDCNGQTIYATEEVRSKTKDYQKDFRLCLLQTMQELDGFYHSYRTESNEVEEAIVEVIEVVEQEPTANTPMYNEILGFSITVIPQGESYILRSTDGDIARLINLEQDTYYLLGKHPVDKTLFSGVAMKKETGFITKFVYKNRDLYYFIKYVSP